MAEPLLASDDDREQALVLLRSASVDGRLTVEDLAARADLVHAARTADDIAAATTGLAPGVAVERPEERHRALLSTTERKGRWMVARRSRFAAVFGTVRLDLREAVLPGPEIEIDAVPVLGTVDIIVPEGVHVQVTGGGAMSKQSLDLPSSAADGAPVIRITARGALGTLRVSTRLGLAEQIKEQVMERLRSQPPS
jgi:uncharacterized protein DUF1707/cell wall-active antibiotic response 4TMS protein YvqF